MFGKLKAWRRIHIRYDSCAHTFLSRARTIEETNAFFTNERLPQADSFMATKAVAIALPHLLRG